MKKTLAVIIAVMLFAGAFTASAAEMPILTVAENNITEAYVVLEIDCGSECADAASVLRIYDTSKEQTIDNLVWAEEFSVSESGKLRIKVDMSSFESAVYRFTVSVEDFPKIKPLEMTFYSKNEKKTLWKSILSAQKDKDTSVIDEIVQTRSEFLGLNKEAFDALKEGKTNFLGNLLGCKFETLDSFVKKFNTGLKLTKYSAATKEDALLLTEEIIEVLNMAQSAAAKAYQKNDELKENVNTRLINEAEKLNVDNYIEIFNTEIILSELGANNDLASGYVKVLKEYKDEIGLDFSDFNSLKNQTGVLNKMMNKTSDFETLADVKEKFETLVDDAKSQGGKGSSGGSGGGGGGSVVRVPQSQTAQENTVKTVFSDTEGVVWAQEAINYLAERNIINGRSEGIFAPNEFVTRAEAVKLIVTAFGIKAENGENVFDDVKNNAWYYSYVMAAYQNGLVNGISESTFEPDAPVTRQDFAVMMSRLIKESAKTAQLLFDDASQISDYAENAVALLVERGIINGNDRNCFEPSKNTTRAQAAKILFEMIKTGV